MKLLLAALLTLAPLAGRQPPETGVVYLYRVEEAPKLDSGKPKVWIDDRPALLMPESEFIGFKLSAGRHVFRMQNKGTVTPLTIEAGKTYFIRVSEVVASGYLRNLFITPSEQAGEQMKGLKPLEDKNIKDKSLSAVKALPN